MYDVSEYANRNHISSHGVSLHDAHRDGYGYDSAPQSLTSLIAPEYEPLVFDYTNGLCYIPPRMASIVSIWSWGRPKLFW
eukprot:5912943-Pleurochrysis_carterae.AAC.2